MMNLCVQTYQKLDSVDFEYGNLEKTITSKNYKKATFKLCCDSRFQRAFTACSCNFKVITLVWANQRNFFENDCRNTALMYQFSKSNLKLQFSKLKGFWSWLSQSCS